MFDLIVIGGGAAGIFAALSAKERKPSLQILILEKTKVLLSKVRISGGGRCNVTHNCFDPQILTKNYPRGSKELIGPFHVFGPRQIIDWFASKKVILKVEEDGRIFPVTDNSETIISCLIETAEKLGVEIRTRQHISGVLRKEEGFQIDIREEPSLFCKKLVIASGSSKDGYQFAQDLGHTIQPPVPSLFTFNVPTSSLSHLSGIALEKAHLRVLGTSLEEIGILLITHFGFSGPAVLRLSAWGARILHEKEYKAELAINWIYPFNPEQAFRKLDELKKSSSQKKLSSENPFKLPKNLWKGFVGKDLILHDYSLKELRNLAEKLCKDSYKIEGKTTHKEEFVTCGGVTLKEVDFKTMESKLIKGLYFAGEILDIDGITGGFNFQNAWTTGFIAGSSSASY